MVRKELNIKVYIKRSIFYIIPGSIMCIVIRLLEKLLGQSIITGIIQIIVGGSLYIILCVIYMIVLKNEIVINNIKSLLKSLRIHRID